MFKADLSLSLDVIYHLIEDEIFEAYINHLFNSSKQYVIIYSSNFQKQQIYHERDRNFTHWIENKISNWVLLEKIESRFLYLSESA